jgi:hypothetical protein
MATSSVNVVPIVASPKRAMEAPDTVVEEITVEHPPPKRVKREMLDYNAVDLSQLKLEDLGVDKKGNRRFRPLLGESLLHCNLTPRGFQWAPFGFDVSGKFKKPSFLSNQPSQRSEGLNLALHIRAKKEYKFLHAIDDFFKTKVAELDPALQWRPLGNYDVIDLLHELYCTKVKVVLAGEGLTQLKVIDRNINIHTGAGWDFLQSHLAAFANFRHARVKVATRLSNLWCVEGKAGLTLTATHLVLTFPKPLPGKKDTDEHTFENVFDDDSILEEIAAE